jgi:hypothetical protein
MPGDVLSVVVPESFPAFDTLVSLLSFDVRCFDRFDPVINPLSPRHETD